MFHTINLDISNTKLIVYQQVILYIYRTVLLHKYKCHRTNTVTDNIYASLMLLNDYFIQSIFAFKLHKYHFPEVRQVNKTFIFYHI